MLDADRRSLRRRGLLYVWIGEIWNLFEAGIALWVGLGANSVALIAFGLDSLVELFAGGVLIWQLSREWNEEEEQSAESRARKLVGLTFFLLAIYIAIQSLVTLLGWFDEPEESLAGIGIVIASAAVMTALYFGKMSVAGKLGSRALRAEAVESLMCDLQDLTLLIGLGLNALAGWWWADPVAAIALIPFFVKEGWENVFEEEEDEG